MAMPTDVFISIHIKDVLCRNILLFCLEFLFEGLMSKNEIYLRYVLWKLFIVQIKYVHFMYSSKIIFNSIISLLQN